MSTNTMLNVDGRVRAHLNELPPEKFESSREAFQRTGFSLIPYVLPQTVKESLAEEISVLADGNSIRRDLQLPETSSTYRKMRNVTAAEIRRRDGWVKAVYESEPFLDALSLVAGEKVSVCPYLPEQYVITRLENSGDTHGWHWDDYSFGLIFVAECPPLENGGFVQTVPGTSWDKKDPRVFEKLTENPIRSYALRPGDIYLLRTDTTLHQVHPILAGRRTIVNMAYAADRDSAKSISHETMEELFRD